MSKVIAKTLIAISIGALTCAVALFISQYTTIVFAIWFAWFIGNINAVIVQYGFGKSDSL
jgi:hypothetical protein